MKKKKEPGEEGISGLSQKDEGVRRVASLALELINARYPLDADHLHALVYPDLSRASFLTAIERDCKRLECCGMHIVKEVDGRELFWHIDEESSYVGDASLTKEEALQLEVLLSPLTSTESFAYRDELKMALLKIDRSFDEEPLVHAGTVRRSQGKAWSFLQDAYASHHLVSVSYLDAQGTKTNKVLAPYGFFSFRDTLYCVGAEKTGAGFKEPRTYRISRMQKPKILAKETYEVPDRFDIEEFRRLPFQMGPTQGAAVFAATHPQPDFLALMEAHGSTQINGGSGRILWEVPSSSWQDAASWGIAQGLVPIAPPELVEATVSCLKEVMQHV